MQNKLIILFVIASFFIGCQETGKETGGSAKSKQSNVSNGHHSLAIKNVLEAHGGFERWNAMRTLSYSKGDERTLVDLKSRKIVLRSPKQTIGFDGTNVWVTPDTVDASRARFYHNLFFYFYAMPFVLGDPGIHYEDVSARKLLDKEYKGIKISYGDGIGDSPKDNYIIWYDPTTFEMKWLMYTVTFKSGETNEDYRLIKYGEWLELGGLMLPVSIQWYDFEDDKVGEMQREIEFENLLISDDRPDHKLFEMPSNAQIAPFEKS